MVMQAEPLYRRVVEIYKTARAKEEFMGLARTKTGEFPANAPTVTPISKKSADKPVEQEQCRKWAAITLPAVTRPVDTTPDVQIPAIQAANAR